MMPALQYLKKLLLVVELITAADTPFSISQSTDPNSELLRLTSNGDLGVGTNNPVSKIHEVEVTSGADKLLTLEGNAPTIFLKESDGSVNQNMQSG